MMSARPSSREVPDPMASGASSTPAQRKPSLLAMSTSMATA